ncbi:hypothetical protein RZS08_20360, partial [Arthrospira platensis SPKY1]|nr:hypothetical protein [Arthrospira platensis SPKY1]
RADVWCCEQRPLRVEPGRYRVRESRQRLAVDDAQARRVQPAAGNQRFDQSAPDKTDVVVACKYGFDDFVVRHSHEVCAGKRRDALFDEHCGLSLVATERALADRDDPAPRHVRQGTNVVPIGPHHDGAAKAAECQTVCLRDQREQCTRERVAPT